MTTGKKKLASAILATIGVVTSLVGFAVDAPDLIERVTGGEHVFPVLVLVITAMLVAAIWILDCVRSRWFLRRMLVKRAWVHHFNPSGNRSKKIVFEDDGTIGLGANDNETTWRLSGTILEIVRRDGRVHNRFRWRYERERFESTNQADTVAGGDSRFRGQYIALDNS